MKHITEIEIFDRMECASLAMELLKLEPFLVDRGGFQTLGASAYLDDPRVYPAMANAFNQINMGAFGKMHDIVNQKLSEHFNMPVGVIRQDVGLPSFHIFGEACNGRSASVHVDEPYERVDFSALDWDHPFSFTLPIALPTVGGGVEFWEIMPDEGNFTEGCYHDYTLGTLYLHDGKTPHRIANRGPMGKGEHRITLQGHGIHRLAGGDAVGVLALRRGPDRCGTRGHATA